MPENALFGRNMLDYLLREGYSAVAIHKRSALPPILCLAPLHGVTNYIYRNAFYRHFSGFDAAMAPFVNSINSETAYAKGRGNHFKDIERDNNRTVRLVPQILSNEPESFIETAATIAGYGYTEVNWNLGCPFPMVTGKKRGSGLLPHTDLIRVFLDRVCPELKIGLSLKIRLGLNDPDEILALIPVFNAYPLVKIIIHPRIGTQMYTGKVDVDGFERAAGLLKHPLVYNGDITDLQGFTRLRERFPSITEWMIGRGAIRDPFLPAVLKGTVLPAGPLSVLRDFHDDLFHSYREVLSGPKHALDKMKEIWTYLGHSVTGTERALKDIPRCKTLESYTETVKRIFGPGARYRGA